MSLIVMDVGVFLLGVCIGGMLCSTWNLRRISEGWCAAERWKHNFERMLKERNAWREKALCQARVLEVDFAKCEHCGKDWPAVNGRANVHDCVPRPQERDEQ